MAAKSTHHCSLAFMLAVGLSFCGSAYAGEGGILGILDKQGEQHRLTDWSVKSSCYTIGSLPAARKCLTVALTSPDDEKKIEQSAKAAGGTSVSKTIECLIPFSSIERVLVSSKASYNSPGKGTLVLRNGQRESVATKSITVEGKEDLGELGASEYSADDDRIKEIRFPRASPQGPSRSASKDTPIPGVVTDRAGKQHKLDDIKTYYSRSNCSYAIHIPCNCGSTGYLSNVFYFKRGDNEVTLDRRKISSITFDRYVADAYNWQVSVKLKSGTTYKLLYKPKSDYLVGKSGDRYVCFPSDTIAGIKFEAAKRRIMGTPAP